MASPRFLTALLACCAVGCGGSEVEAPTEATARAFALPHQWTSEDQLPVSTHGAPLLEGHLAFSLEIRKLPAGEIPEEIRSHYQTQFGGMRDAKRDVFDVVRGDTVLYSPLEVKRTSCVRRGRPDYWWRVQKCLEEELIPRTTYAWNEAKRRELPQTCVRVIAPADAPYPVLAKLIEVLGRESLLLTQVEVVVTDPATGNRRGLRARLPYLNGIVDFVEPEGWEESLLENTIEEDWLPEPGTEEWEQWVQDVREDIEDWGWGSGWTPVFTDTGARIVVIHPGTPMAEIRSRADAAAAQGPWSVLLGDPGYESREAADRDLIIQDWVATWDRLRAVSDDIWVWP